jgi:hypothetical protein
VPIDVHGSLDRAKDVSSSVEPLFRRFSRRVRALGARRRRSPPHSPRGHLLSSVRPPDRERAPTRRTGPTKTHAPPATREGCRHPVDQGAFHRCSDGHVRGSLLFVFPRRPPAHAAHTLPPWLGTKCLSGIASIAVGTSPAVISREQVTFDNPLARSSRGCRAWD